MQFRHHVPLISAPDPRRFDVRATLRDPFEQVHVRVYQQTSSIPVYVVADMSASMDYHGNYRKPDTLADFIEGMAYASYKMGDRFGFIGCGNAASKPLILPSTLNRVAGVALANRLREVQFNAQDALGLLQAAPLIGSRKALVFLISDYHFSQSLIQKIIASLSYHDVIPVVLWDETEYRQLPKFGLSKIKDQETGRQRLLFIRPSIKRKIEDAFATRRQALSRLFNTLGREPLFLENGFKPDEVTRYFYN